MASNFEINGTVTWVKLSGGFWGIVSADGKRYRSVDALPVQFQHEGMRVKAKVRPSDGFSIFMWGQEVHVLSISSN